MPRLDVPTDAEGRLILDVPGALVPGTSDDYAAVINQQLTGVWQNLPNLSADVIGVGTWRFQVSNAANAPVLSDVVRLIPASIATVATPAIAPAGPNIDAAQGITITCATSGATIYYTTDGTDPRTSITRSQWTADFYLTEGVYTVLAFAEKADLLNSTDGTTTYDVGSDLPDLAISISFTDPSVTISPPDLPVSISMIGGNAPIEPADLAVSITFSDPPVDFDSSGHPRLITVGAQSRTMTVPANDRTITVPAKSRTYTVSA